MFSSNARNTRIICSRFVPTLIPLVFRIRRGVGGKFIYLQDEQNRRNFHRSTRRSPRRPPPVVTGPVSISRKRPERI